MANYSQEKAKKEAAQLKAAKEKELADKLAQRRAAQGTAAWTIVSIAVLAAASCAVSANISPHTDSVKVVEKVVEQPMVARMIYCGDTMQRLQVLGSYILGGSNGGEDIAVFRDGTPSLIGYSGISPRVLERLSTTDYALVGKALIRVVPAENDQQAYALLSYPCAESEPAVSPASIAPSPFVATLQ